MRVLEFRDPRGKFYRTVKQSDIKGITCKGRTVVVEVLCSDPVVLKHATPYEAKKYYEWCRDPWYI